MNISTRILTGADLAAERRRQYIEDHGDPGPDDHEIEAADRDDRLRDEPTLNAWERNR